MNNKAISRKELIDGLDSLPPVTPQEQTTKNDLAVDEEADHEDDN